MSRRDTDRPYEQVVIAPFPIGHLAMHIAAPLLLLLSFPFASYALDECEYCKAKRVCSVHAEEEAEVLSAAEDGWRNADEASAVGTLERVAALTDAHTNAPSKKVASFLADALDHSSLVVRTRASELLARGQEPDTSVRALVATLPDVAQSLRAATDDASRAAAIAYGEAALASLGSLRDDRSVKAITGWMSKQLRGRDGQPFALTACSALATLGSRDAVSWLVKARADLVEPAHATEALTTLANVVGLSAPPADDDASLKSWVSALKKKLPARLGKLKVE